MQVQIQIRVVSNNETVLSEDVIACFDKGDDQLEEVGLSLEQAKTMLAGAQTSLVAAQAASFLARHRCCELCGRHLQSKGRCRLLFRTAFGTVPLVSPRVYRCACQPAASKTFSPLAALFTEHTAPELLYLETRWASLMSFGLTAGLLKDVLPVDTRTNAATIRNHLYKISLRQELGDGQSCLAEVEGDTADGKELPLPPRAGAPARCGCHWPGGSPGSVRSRAKMRQNHKGWCLMNVKEPLHLEGWRET